MHAFRRDVLQRFPLIVLTFLFRGETPSGSAGLQKQLDQLTRRGCTYQYVEPDLIELSNPQAGFHQIKALREPPTSDIQLWARAHGLPTLEIDPSQIDTTLFIGWYTYWTQVPLSNSFGAPLLVADLNRNGKAEVYGIFKDYTTGYGARAYQIDTNGAATLMNTYSPIVFPARHAVDLDGDSLYEVLFDSSQVEYGFTQASPESIPTSLKFAYRMWEASGIFTRHYVGDLDGDNRVDFLYRGDQFDTSCHSVSCIKTYIAEYNSTIANFERVWSIQWRDTSSIGGDVGVAGYAVGDFDNDGRKEFVASSIWGNLFVGENTGDDTYAEVWRDSLPYVNMYYQTQGNVDNDGRMEFFVGATMSDGYWLTVFEADSNNHYSPRFLFHILAGGSLDEPTNLTADIDGDGVPELVLLTGGYVLIFKSNGNDSYYLWYLKRLTFGYALGTYDFNHDGKRDFIISGDEVSGENLRLRAEIYLATFVVSVPREPSSPPQEFELYQNFPNPFNPTTRIRFSLPKRAYVSLQVFDIEGKQVADLFEKELDAGSHSVDFNGERLASGVYLCRLKVAGSIQERKMVLIK